MAALAAAVNADFMIRAGISVSHLTGDFSRVTIEVARHEVHWGSSVMVLVVSIGGFVAGAAMSGYFIHHPRVDAHRPYGRAILGIGGVLLLAQAIFERFPIGACFLAAGACGFQNALATRYRGLILRTTHLTGLLTDLGHLVGMRLRGCQVELWKITTPLWLAVSFAFGASVAAWLRIGFGAPVLGGCGVAYAVGGLTWSICKRWPQSRR
nr:YoaK family protein [Haloferula luteola]